MIQDFYSKLSEKEKKVFFGAVIIGSLMFFDMLFLRPILSKLQEEDIEIESKSSDIKQALRFLSYENKMRQEEKAFQVYHTDESKSEEEIIAGFLKTVELLASEAKVNLIKLSPAEVDTKKGYYEYHANLECEGRLEDVLKFMHTIDTTENLLKITKYSMTRQKASAEGVSASIRIAKLIIDPKTIGNYAFISEEGEDGQAQETDQAAGAEKTADPEKTAEQFADGQPAEANTDSGQTDGQEENSDQNKPEQAKIEPEAGAKNDPAAMVDPANPQSALNPGATAGTNKPEITRSAQTAESMGADEHVVSAPQDATATDGVGGVNRRESGSGGAGPRAIGQRGETGQRGEGSGQGSGEGGSAEPGNPSADNGANAGGQPRGAESGGGGQTGQDSASPSSTEEGGEPPEQKGQAGEQGQESAPGEGQGVAGPAGSEGGQTQNQASPAGDQTGGAQGTSGQGQSAAGQPGTSSAGGPATAGRQSGVGSGGGTGGAGQGQGGESGAGGESGGGEPTSAGSSGGVPVSDRGLPGGGSGGDSGSANDGKAEKPAPKKVKKDPNKLQNKLDEVNKGKRFQVEDFGTLWNNFWGIKPKAGSQKPESRSLKNRDGEDEGIEDKPNLWEKMIKPK